MVWESNAVEHGRIASGLAGLIPRALELGDVDTALRFAESLAREAARDGEAGWRGANARAALLNIETPVVTGLIERALDSESYHAKEGRRIARRDGPGAGVELVELLGRYRTSRSPARCGRRWSGWAGQP